MLVGKNVRRSAVTGNALLRSLRLGVSATGLMLAGAALSPASAQVRDLGGATVNGTGFGAFTVYTNGTFRDSVGIGGETYAGAMNDLLGAFALTKLGLGTLTLTGSGLNTYSGQTTISLGTLRAGAANVLSANSLMRINSGSLDLNGFNQSVLGLSGGGTVVNAGAAATLTLTNNAGSNLYTGIISGDTRLIKQGAGQQNLSGANTFTGGIALANGTLGYGSNLAFGTGAVTVTGASTLSASNAALNIGNNIILNAGLTWTGAASTLSGVISGAGTLTKASNGGLTLTNAANSFSGGILFNAGQIRFGNGALGTGTITTTAQQVTMSTAGGSASIGNNIVLGGQLNFELPTGPDILALTGVISGAGTLYSKSGTGTLLLSGANTYSGGTLVDVGTLGIQNATAAGTGLIRFSGASVGLAAYANGLNIANNINTSQITAVDTRGFNMTLSGVIANINNANIGGLNKTGAGTLALTGVNKYTDATTVSGGQLNINGSLTSNVTVASGAALGGTGSVAAANSVTILSGGNISPGTAGFGTLTLGTLDLQTGSIFNLDLSTAGVLGGGVNDAIITTQYNVGNGAILSVNFSGAITPGLYPFLSATALASIVGGGFTVNPAPTDFTYAVQYGLTTSLLVTFTGLRFWDGTGPFGDGTVNGGDGVWNTASGNWTNSTGVAQTTWGNTAGVFSGLAGAVTVAGAQAFTNLDFRTAGYVLSGDNLAINNSVINTSVAGDTTINNIISGTNGLTKQGIGTLILNGANTFTGGFAVTAGAVRVGSNTALGAIGSASFGAGTTLRTLGNRSLAMPLQSTVA